MPDRDCGPYETAEQVRAVVSRAYDDSRSGRASLRTSGYAMLNAACSAAEVRTGDFDRQIMDWLAGIEIETCAVFAGLVARAYQAGLANREGSVTEWGVRYSDPDGAPGHLQRYYDEDTAREARREVEALDPSRRGTVVSRQVWAGPWTRAPIETGEGRD